MKCHPPYVGILKYQGALNFYARGPDLETIFYEICSFFNTSPSEILEKKRTRKVVFPRHCAIYIIDRYYPFNKSEIARLFDSGRKTIYSAVSVVEGQLTSKFDNEFKDNIPLVTAFLEKKGLLALGPSCVPIVT